MSHAFRSRTFLALLSCSVAACALAACSDDPGSGTANDAGELPDVDLHVDGGHDAGAFDATPGDGGADATTGDASHGDAGADAATGDASADSAADSAVDAAADTGVDAAHDATADSAPEASIDAAPEASIDAAAEAATDASNDAAHVITDAGEAGSAFVAPTCDGVIGAGEYGVHTDGQNQQSTNGQTWYATWDDTNVYLAVDGANIAEGAVVYFSTAPSIGVDAGTSANGTTTGFTYDGEDVAGLPLHAQLAAYVKATYNETRTANGANGWNGAQAAALTVCTTGTTREFSIPWASISGGARPASFGWFGLVTSSGGFVYAEVPTDNPGGSIGTNATYPWYYLVANATPVTGDKPFATKLSR